MHREPREKRFEIRLSEKEQERFYRCATACNMTPTSYLRNLIWFLHPAKLPLEKYDEMQKQLIKMNREIKSLTAEIRLRGEIPGKEITDTMRKMNTLIDEIQTAIQHPFDAIDPRRVDLMPMEQVYGKEWGEEKLE